MIPSPLHRRHLDSGAVMLRYGGGEGGVSAEVVEAFGDIEVEYAALRKGCVLIDLPQRGTVRVAGSDRGEFLNRMLTQELKGLERLGVRRSFWLSRKGRIEADLRVMELGSETVIDVDVLRAARTVETLGAFVITEDVTIEDAGARFHRLALHGPTAGGLLRSVAVRLDGAGVEDLAPGSGCVVEIAGRRVTVDRQDETGDPGFHLLLESGDVEPVYHALLAAGVDAGAGSGAIARGAARLKQAGWGAWNIARIEAGTAVFNIDFGVNNLPAETGVIDERVSFRKGCYLGQEVVARMHSLGHPKQKLVSLRVEAPAGPEAQPVTGAAVAVAGDEERVPVGAVTSSTRSPMLGDACIALAQVKWDHTAPGTALMVQTDAGWRGARVGASLRSWARA